MNRLGKKISIYIKSLSQVKVLLLKLDIIRLIINYFSYTVFIWKECTVFKNILYIIQGIYKNYNNQ